MKLLMHLKPQTADGTSWQVHKLMRRAHFRLAQCKACVCQIVMWWSDSNEPGATPNLVILVHNYHIYLSGLQNMMWYKRRRIETGAYRTSRAVTLDKPSLIDDLT